jgi:hypothetical protein
MVTCLTKEIKAKIETGVCQGHAEYREFNIILGKTLLFKKPQPYLKCHLVGKLRSQHQTAGRQIGVQQRSSALNFPLGLISSLSEACMTTLFIPAT